MVDLFDRAQWEPEQVHRDYQLRPPAAPPSVARQHHHGSRDDRVSYVLSARPGTPVAVVATVGSQHDPRTGLARAIRQATKLDVPLAYATNGHQIVEHFVASGQTRSVDDFATPIRAWRSYLRLHHLRRAGAQLVSQPFDHDILSDGSAPVQLRYYQGAAIARALGAISQPERRVLISLPAGTGTTFVAAALMAKFAAYELATHPRDHVGMLYLDDRPVGQSTRSTLAPVRRLAESTAADVTIGSLGDSFDGLDPASVNLVVVNLAHGGQTADQATWRDVLDRFPDAYQVGIVGVPPAQAEPVYEYFGRPVYRYTDEQARADAYLPATPAGAPDPADSAPEEIDVTAFREDQEAPAGDSRDPVAVAVQIRRSVEYANLAAGQVALAAKLVSLLQVAKRPGPVGRAAGRRASELNELELLAELEDQVGGEQAILRHIALLRQLLSEV